MVFLLNIIKRNDWAGYPRPSIICGISKYLFLISGRRRAQSYNGKGERKIRLIDLKQQS